MPLPQVNDRLKEIPAQALRTVFATIGQLLLAADRLRAKAAGQLSGSGEATATRPADQAPAPAPPPPAKPAKPATPARPDAGNSRWRSLDKTGNVRVLDGGEEQDDEDVPRVGQAVPEPSPAPVPSAEYTPTEVVPAVSVPAEPEPAMQQEARPAMQQEAKPASAEVAAEQPVPTEPAQAEPAMQQEARPAQAEPAMQQEARPAMQQEAEPAQPVTTAGQALPVANYDQLSVASLRARLRVLDAGQVQALLDYENVHESRPAVITMFERRLTKLGEGN
jgi:outer membrane biosynthesis protein TonB